MVNSIKIIRNSSKNWYIPFIIGLIFALIGIYCVFFSYESYNTLSKILGFSIVFSGVIEIYGTIKKIKEDTPWQWSMISGLSEIAIGFILVNRPEISFVLLSIFVAFMVFLRSLNALINAIELRTIGMKDWWFLVVLGVFGIVLSYILIDNPKLAGQTVAFWIGIGLILVGGFGIYFSLKLRSLKKMSEKIPSELKDKWDAVHNEIKTKLRE
jgi:uncharacterized membrane protein HdeD (DUF308 family)